MKQVVFLFASCLSLGAAMLVKDWGTSIHDKRLASATRDLFDSSVDLMNLGNPESALPTVGWTTNITLSHPNDKSQQSNIDLRLFRVYLTNPHINYSKILDHGNLRRFIMTTTEKMLHDKGAASRGHGGHGHQHEMFICNSCIFLQFSGLHVGFHVKSQDPPVYYYGSAALPGTINYVISFQLDIMMEKEREKNQFECLFKYEASPLELSIHPNDVTVQGSKAVFLVDDLEKVLVHGLNTTILEDLNARIQNAFRYVARNTDAMCANFLTTGVFSPRTSGVREQRV